MKKSILICINALIATLMGLLGVSCHIGYAEYGSPYATFEMSGTVTDEQEQPLENLQVAVRDRWDRENGSLGYVVCSTNSDGQYAWRTQTHPWIDSFEIIVRDTAGVYESDSVNVGGLEFDRSGVSKQDHWNCGKAEVQQDFVLKKKQ